LPANTGTTDDSRCVRVVILFMAPLERYVRDRIPGVVDSDEQQAKE
jgi:hypothetical protein